MANGTVSMQSVLNQPSPMMNYYGAMPNHGAIQWPTIDFPGMNPTFPQVTSELSQPINIQAPTGGISPQTQEMINILTRQAESKARAGALRRGMEGSTTELLDIGRATTEASLPLIQQDLERQAQRGNLQAQLELDRQKALATLGSEEMASQRNIAMAGQQLQLQERIANRTAEIMQQNIGVSQDIAEEQAKNELYGSLIGAFGPVIALKMLGGVGGGGGGGFLGMGGGGSTGVGGLPGMLGGSSTVLGQMAGAPMVGATMPAGGTATVSGLGTVPVAGATTSPWGGFGANPVMTPLAGIGGWQLGMRTFRPTPGTGERGAMNVGAGIGGVAGGYFGGPLGAGIGSFLGAGYGKLSSRIQQGAEKRYGKTVGSVVKYANPVTAIASAPRKIKKISRSISKAFPF